MFADKLVASQEHLQDARGNSSPGVKVLLRSGKNIYS